MGRLYRMNDDCFKLAAGFLAFFIFIPHAVGIIARAGKETIVDAFKKTFDGSKHDDHSLSRRLRGSVQLIKSASARQCAFYLHRAAFVKK